MEKAFIKARSDYCPYCGQNGLMAMSVKGRPMHYVTKNPTATTESIMEKINTDTIKDLVCNYCGKHVLCDYSLGFPRGISKEALYQSFFNGYFNGKE